IVIPQLVEIRDTYRNTGLYQPQQWRTHPASIADVDRIRDEPTGMVAFGQGQYDLPGCWNIVAGPIRLVQTEQEHIHYQPTARCADQTDQFILDLANHFTLVVLIPGGVVEELN